MRRQSTAGNQNSQGAAVNLDCGPNVRFGPMAGQVGLENMGNTCFMNAGLQCLTHIEPLATYFLSGQFTNDVSSSSSSTSGSGEQSARKEKSTADCSQSKGRLAKSFAALTGELWQTIKSKQPQKGGKDSSSKKVLAPKEFRNTFKEIQPFLFEDYEQQDVQEFLCFCLDGLNEDLNRVPSLPSRSEAQDKEDERLCKEKGEEFAASLAWYRHLEREKSFLVDLLQGQLRSSVRCMKCGNTSLKFEPFMYLSVPVEQNMTHVTDAIDKYLEEEVLTGDECWYCDQCKAKVKAKKKIDLWYLPPVLVLHLKRFDSQLQKIEKKLNMKVSSLDLSGFCDKKQKDGAIYNVACVANHHGSYDSGHYTAICRVGANSGSWRLFDDGEVTELKDNRSVVTQHTYVVFLVRCPTAEDDRSSGDVGRRLTSKTARPLMRRQSTSNPKDWPHPLSPAIKARNAAVSFSPPKLEDNAAVSFSPPKLEDNVENSSQVAESENPASVEDSRWTCPHCDEINRVSRSECNNCGKPVTKVPGILPHPNDSPCSPPASLPRLEEICLPPAALEEAEEPRQQSHEACASAEDSPAPLAERAKAKLAEHRLQGAEPGSQEKEASTKRQRTMKEFFSQQVKPVSPKKPQATQASPKTRVAAAKRGVGIASSVKAVKREVKSK